MSSNTLEVIVHRMTRSSDRTLLIELRPTHPLATLPSFEPGAHIDVHLGSLVRQYSLINADDEGQQYVICVLREASSRGGSAFVHERLRVGDRLTVSAPRNTFPLASHPHHAVLIGGGIGITPLLSMAESLHRRGASFELHCYATSEYSLPMREFLDGRHYLDRIQLHFSEMGDSFRDLPLYLSARPADTVAYVCGPKGFIETSLRHTEVAGWDASTVRVERFEVSAPVELSGRAFMVVAHSTGEELPVGDDETIAEVLERAGYQVFLSCEQGICGSCITGVLAGVPDHRDEVQSTAEHGANTQINICCSRSLTPVLELDI
jgi:vanillate O-demethylase ferredoxin subunit